MISRSQVPITRTDENVMTDINYGSWGLQEGLWSRDLDINQLLEIMNRSVVELKQLLTTLPNRERTIEFERRIQLIETKLEGTIKARASRAIDGEVLRSDLNALLAEKQARIETLERMIQKYEMSGSDKQERLASIEDQLRWNSQMLAQKDLLLADVTSKLEDEIKRSGYYRDAINAMKRNIDSQRGRNDIDKIVLRGVNLPNLSESSNINFQELSKMTMTRKDEKDMVVKAHILSLMKDMEDYLRGVKIISLEAITNTLRPLMTFLNIAAVDQPHILYRRMRQRVEAIASLYHSHITKIKEVHPQLRDVEVDPAIEQLRKESGVEKVSIVDGFVYLEKGGASHETDQLRRTMNTIVIELKAISQRYPKLKDELTHCGVLTLLEQPLWKLGSLDNVTQIIQYVPEAIRVENISKSTQRSKTELHLRALLRALLTDFELAKQGKQGFLDQAIIIGLTKQLEQFGDLEELFRLYYPASRGLREVQKIVERVVERIVEVPVITIVDRLVEKIVNVEKIVQVEKPIHIPVEVIRVVEVNVDRIVEVEKIIDRIVQVPTVVEKIIEVVKEVEKVFEIEKIVEVEIIREKEVIVEKQVPYYITEYKEIEIVVERLVPVETIVERIVEVPVIVERIEVMIKEVPKIVEVEKYIDRPYKVVEDREVHIVENHIQVKYEPVDRIIEKLVPVVKIEQVPVEIEKIVEKIVRVVERQEIIKEVEVIREVIVERQVPVEVIRTVKEIVPLVQEVIKEVVRRVDVPVIVEKLVVVPVEIIRIEIQTVEREKIKEVPTQVIKIVTERQVVELERIVHHIERVPEVHTVTVEKIVEVPLIHERIREERVIVEKIIEKLVEVPKVVEVQRIVQKIVVVPRIVERIVEVPQIIERIVQRIVEVEKIVEVERVVQVPVIQEKIVFVDRVITQVVEQEVVVDRLVERLVPVETVVDRIVEIEKVVEKPIQIRQEVPRELTVERIVPVTKQVEKLVEVQVEKIVTLEVKTPIDRIVEKLVQVEHYVEKILKEPVVQEKVKILRDVEVQLVEVERRLDKIVVERQFVEIQKSVPVVHNQIIEVPTERTVNVAVQCAYEVAKEVPVMHEKVVEVHTQRTGIHEVQKLVEKMVKVPHVVEVERTVPVILLQQQAVPTRIDNVVVVPLIQQEIRQVQAKIENPVAVMTIQNQVQLVERLIQKLVIQKEVQTIEKIVNYIQTQIQPVDRIEEKIVEVRSTVEKLVEVPTIVEKVVERIIMMPQVVELTREINTIQQAEDLEGMPRPKRILTDLELIDIFAVSLDKLWRTNRDIETGLPEDIAQFIESKTSPKNMTKSAIFASSQTSYTSQSQLLASSRVVNREVSLPPNRTAAELVELMASRLCAIKQQFPTADLGASEGICHTYLTNRGKVWLDMERELDKSHADLQRTRVISERNSDIMHNLKLSYDILFEKYRKQDTLLSDIRTLAEKLSLQELLDMLGDPKTERSLLSERNPLSERVTLSPLRSSVGPSEIDPNFKQLQNDLKQKVELLAIRDKELATLKSDISTMNLKQNESNEQLRRQLTRYLEQQKSLQEELKVVKTAKQAVDREYERVKKERDELRVEYNLFKQESIELKAKLHKTELNKSTQDIKASYENQIRDLKTSQDQTNQRYTKDVAVLRQTVESLEVGRTNSIKEIDSLRIQLSQMEVSRNEAAALVQQLQNQLHLLRNRPQPSSSCNHEPQFSNLREKYRTLEQQKRDLERSVEESNRSVEQHSRTIATQQKQISELIEETTQLRQELHGKDKDLLYFRADNDKHERAKAMVRNEVQSYQNQISVSQRQNLMLIDELRSLRTSREELEKELFKLKQQHGERSTTATKPQSAELDNASRDRPSSVGDVQMRIQTEPTSADKGLSQRLYTQPNQPATTITTLPPQPQAFTPSSPSPNLVALMTSTVSTDVLPAEKKPELNAGNNQQKSPQSQFAPMSPVNILRATSEGTTPTEARTQASPFSTINLQDFISLRVEDMLASNVMLIIIDRIRDEIRQGRMNVYEPRKILLMNYDPARLDRLQVQFLDPVSQEDYKDCLYCSPELIRGQLPTEKSLVYNIGLIWDEVLHGQRHYRSTEQILNKASTRIVTVDDYKVRNTRINPIFKNSLFEMLQKDPTKRINFNEVQNRLSLQKYIHKEERVYAQRTRRDRPPYNN